MVLRCAKKEILLHIIVGTTKTILQVPGGYYEKLWVKCENNNDDKFIRTKENIASIFNKFFKNAGRPDLAKNITTPAGSSVFDYLKKQKR